MKLFRGAEDLSKSGLPSLHLLIATAYFVPGINHISLGRCQMRRAGHEMLQK